MLDELYMRRCFDLAIMGSGNVSPNPMVGAVLVHNDRIIGEGWHQRYGQSHAEVNAIEDVKPWDRQFIESSTMYVSLEPCSFHGNTPACTNLIIESRIPRVVISTVDKTPGVNGEGIRILRAAGVDVVVGVLEEEGRELSRFRNHFVSKNRPFIILKFAESADGFIGVDGKQVWLSNNFSKRFVHKLRSSFDALMVGTGTVITDNPVLTNRYWYGRSPVRIIIDKNLVIPDSSRCYGSEARTIVFTAEEKLTKDNIEFVPLNFDKLFLRDLLTKLFERRITSLIVEGGRKTLQHFIDEDLWDEAIVISTTKMIYKGISAPRFSGVRIHQFRLQKDLITIFRNSLNGS